MYPLLVCFISKYRIILSFVIASIRLPIMKVKLIYELSPKLERQRRWKNREWKTGKLTVSLLPMIIHSIITQSLLIIRNRFLFLFFFSFFTIPSWKDCYSAMMVFLHWSMKPKKLYFLRTGKSSARLAFIFIYNCHA